MKVIKNLMLLAVAATMVLSCEKNDPLGDQGILTGNLAPFNLLAQMPDAKVNDTLMLRTVAWATNDDMNNISFFYRGFSVKNYSVRMQITVSGAPKLFQVTHRTDSLFIPRTLIRSYPQAGESLNLYYQTAENAYVIVCPFVVATGFSLLVQEGPALINAMPNSDFSAIVHKISLQMNRADVRQLWPSAPITCFEFDANGNFTGNLTEFGFNYVRENLTRALLIQHLIEATVDDNTRGTIESVATVATTSRTSSRNFRIIK